MQTETFGQKLVGVTFNPSDNIEVDKVKRLLAEAIDIVNNRAIARETTHADLVKNATYELVSAQMAAVKAITWDK